MYVCTHINVRTWTSCECNTCDVSQVCRATSDIWTLVGDDRSPLQVHRPPLPGQTQAIELTSELVQVAFVVFIGGPNPYPLAVSGNRVT